MFGFIAIFAVAWLAFGVLTCLFIAPYHRVRPRGYLATILGWPFVVVLEGHPPMGHFIGWATYA